MPASPTAAQSEASRLNGARSSGPATPEGKARSALNGTRHGLRGRIFTLLPDEDPAEWAALLDGYLARLRPIDAAETLCVERLAACNWRERRLERIEAETLFAAGPDNTSEPDPRLGLSRTLPRYAAAIRRDRKEALERLETFRASRPRLPATPTEADAARLRWLADRIERKLAATSADDAREPEPQAARARPSAEVPPTADVTPEPEPQPAVAPSAPPARPLNREQRRRLAALARQSRPSYALPPPSAAT